MKYIFTLDDEYKSDSFPIGIQSHHDNGMKSPMRYISYQQFMTALAPIKMNGLYDKNASSNEVRVPILPNGTVGYSSELKENGMIYEKISFIVDKNVLGIRHTSFNGIQFLGFPKLMFHFVLSHVPNTNESRLVKESYVYAMKDAANPITDATSLYIFPFPNVNKGSHEICWGKNNLTSIPNLSAFSNLTTLFITSEFNDDYGLMMDGVKKRSEKFSDFIEEFKNKPFNEDLLIPAKRVFGQLYGERILNYPNNDNE